MATKMGAPGVRTYIKDNSQYTVIENPNAIGAIVGFAPKGERSLVRYNALIALSRHRGVHGGVNVSSGGFHYGIPKFGHSLTKSRVLVAKTVDKR